MKINLTFLLNTVMICTILIAKNELIEALGIIGLAVIDLYSYKKTR